MSQYLSTNYNSIKIVVCVTTQHEYTQRKLFIYMCNFDWLVKVSTDLEWTLIMHPLNFLRIHVLQKK